MGCGSSVAAPDVAEEMADAPATSINRIRVPQTVSRIRGQSQKGPPKAALNLNVTISTTGDTLVIMGRPKIPISPRTLPPVQPPPPPRLGSLGSYSADQKEQTPQPDTSSEEDSSSTPQQVRKRLTAFPKSRFQVHKLQMGRCRRNTDEDEAIY